MMGTPSPGTDIESLNKLKVSTNKRIHFYSWNESTSQKQGFLYCFIDVVLE